MLATIALLALASTPATAAEALQIQFTYQRIESIWKFACHSEPDDMTACVASEDGDLVRTAVGVVSDASGGGLYAELWCDPDSGLVTEDGLEAECLIRTDTRQSQPYTTQISWLDLGRYNIGDWVGEYVDEWMEDADH